MKLWCIYDFLKTKQQSKFEIGRCLTRCPAEQTENFREFHAVSDLSVSSISNSLPERIFPELITVHHFVC